MKLSRKTIFQESGLKFKFDTRWVIRKYDDHNYYRGLSSAGLKAVDFIGVFKDHAVFIEVKNYGQRSPKKAEEILLDPKAFIEGMIKKVEDTRIGIRAVHGYFGRNWIYGLIYTKLLQLNIRRWSSFSWVFWAQLYYRIWEKQDLEIIFCFEFLDKYEGISTAQQESALKQIEAALKENLEEEKFRVRVLVNSGGQLDQLMERLELRG